MVALSLLYFAIYKLQNKLLIINLLLAAFNLKISELVYSSRI